MLRIICELPSSLDPDWPRDAGVRDERVVADAWERQSFPPAALQSLGLSVVFRGMPSDAGGPDVQDAVLAQADGGLITGDVEFHVDAADWYRHGHHLNSAYNGVVLHLVWRTSDRATIRKDGAEVPVLALQPWIRTIDADSHNQTQQLPPHPCVARFSGMQTPELMQHIRRMGMERFSHRTELFAADLAALEPDQVAYRWLLRGLGYASNVSAFSALADAVPYAWLMALAPSDRATALLAGAGLIQTDQAEPPARLDPSAWRLARLRPANHPSRRLVAFATLLERMQPTLSDGLAQMVDEAQRPRDVREALCVHLAGGACIGQGRADELAVSVVLPYVAALHPSGTQAEWLYATFPSPPANRWTRHVISLLAQAGHRIDHVSRAIEHQGLHHLYHSFCRSVNSEGCSLCHRVTMKAAR